MHSYRDKFFRLICASVISVCIANTALKVKMSKEKINIIKQFISVIISLE
jgi:hypothetical protein